LVNKLKGKNICESYDKVNVNLVTDKK